MPLTPELEAAAQALGRALLNSRAVQTYTQTTVDYEADEDLAALELQLTELYHQLSAREHAGQVLSPQEINRYHNLLDQVRHHPCYAAREAALRSVRANFVETVEVMNSILAVNFASLAET